jgi:hypothetical protein
MVKVSFKYNPELVQWLKQTGTGSRWNPTERTWEVPDGILEELKVKANELGVDLNITGAAPTSKLPGKQQTFEKNYIEWEEPEISLKPRSVPYRVAHQEAPSGTQ